MGCHWCGEETMAILMLLPFANYFKNWFVNVWKKRHEKPNCQHKDHGHGNLH